MAHSLEIFADRINGFGLASCVGRMDQNEALTMTYHVTVRKGWSYVVRSPLKRDPPPPYSGPWRYQWEAQEYADELNAKENADAEIVEKNR
jgi:hypothetical protein